MSGEEQIKLVLNIDTPQFFQNQNTGGLSTGKRKSDQPIIGHPPSKKQRSSHPSGKSFKSSRLKVVSSLQSLKDSSLLKDRKPAVTSTSPKSKILDSHDPENGKQKVTFSSKVEIFSSKDESSNDLPTFMQPDNVSKRKVSNKNKDSGLKQNATAKPAKPISSLFSKNPDIPSIEQKDNRSELKKQEVFSTLTFNELDISPKLISTLEKLGYSSMTYVQHLSIPVILKGSDALVKSQTGSGKTLVYVLPIIHKLMVREPKVERSHGLYALIIVPTRELAIQTYQWLEKLCKSCVWVVPGYLMGGEKKKAEKARLRKGINILVATPGRLMDHIDNTSSLDLNKVEYLVLDEADRMLDLGYEKGITSIVYSLNKEKNSDSRQTLMLSATLTSAVEKLAGISLKSPKVIDVTSDTTILEDGSTIAEGLVTPQNLTQHFMLVPVKLRLVTLASFIIEKCKFSEEKKMLVFMTTQDMVDYHTSLFAHVLSKIGKMKPPPSQNGPSHSLLKRANKVLMGIDDDDEAEEDDDEEDIDKEDENDIHFVKLHGNMSQPERTAVFKSFHEATSGVLLCTDVASRGLDLPQVNWIVQYNPAITPADYVHRVGRTARASMSGSAVVFVSPSESNYVTMLEEQGIQFDQIMMEKVLRILTRRTLYNQDFEKVPSSMEIAATRLQDKFENAVQADRDLRDMAVQGYVSFVRSYAAIPKAAREYFCFKLLHLGHYAKSFALRDPPAVLGARGAKKRFRSERPSGHTAPIRRRKEEFNEEKPLLIQRVFSEFDSGLDD